MAVATRLPNGYVVLLMTPREAVMVRDQLLEPGEYPWQASESQLVSMEVRDILTKAVVEDAQHRLAEAANELQRAMIDEQARRQAEETGEVAPEPVEEEKKKRKPCGACGQLNGSHRNVCRKCGFPLPKG